MENIFFSLEYDSFMACKKVCKPWNALYSSEQYRQKELELFEEHKKREEMEEKLRHYSSHGMAWRMAVIKQLIAAGGDINARDARPTGGAT